MATMEALEGELKTNVEKLKASELTLEQLQSLDLCGEEQMVVSTLEDFLTCCQELGLRKPLAVEVRHIHSDVGRACLIRIMSNYNQEAEARQGGSLMEGSYKGLGTASLVANPSRFASTFGEF